MIISSFIVEEGRVDSNGNCLNLSGLRLPDAPVVVTREFDVSQPIGMATVYREKNAIMATMCGGEAVDGYPAVGVQVLKSAGNTHGGRDILEARLMQVSISSQPNADLAIKRISEQAAG